MEQAFLQIIAGVRRGLSIPVREGKALSIGRRTGDLLLDDPLVSSAHCKIERRGAGFVLVDLGSTNGTMVDGRMVREVALSAGSEIAIGANRMILMVGEEPSKADGEAAPAPSQSQLEIAWLLDEELVEVRPNRRGVKDVAVGADGPADVIGQDLRLPPGLNAVVEVVAGQDAGKVFRFTRGNVSVGRKMGEVPLTDVEVSRHHAVVEVFGRDMIFLRDLGSTNGTYHNGRRIQVSKLEHGDTIGCGKTVMKLQVSR